MSLNCPACATENREGAKCCKDCGAPLVQHCPECAAPCKLGANFCGQCGHAFRHGSGSRSVAALLPSTG